VMPGRNGATPPSVGVALLTWNDHVMTVEAARSYLLSGADEVVVVDNGSVPEVSRNLARELPPEVRLERLCENVGYSRGMNLGLRMLTTTICVGSNNDLTVSEDFVSALRRVPDNTLAFAKSEDGLAHGRPYPTIVRALGAATGLQAFWPTRLGLVETSKPDWYEGACVVATTSTWTRLDFIPERHFIFGEEILLCRAADRIGVEKQSLSVRLTGHHDGVSTARRWSRPKLIENSTWAYWDNVIHEWPAKGRIIVSILCLGSILKIAVFRGEHRRDVLAQLRGLYNALRRRTQGPES
jgi:N-acetylglucosaminyl-diphospho-decaprenol L-rhamnosyltransferase